MNWSEADLAKRGKAPVKRHKYGAKPTTIDGIRFDSQAEAGRYQELRFLERRGRIRSLTVHPRYEFPMGFAYEADFAVEWDDGTREVIDVKGVETAVFRLKRKCFEHFYPALKLTIWKARG